MNIQNYQSTLISLAMLKVDINRGRSYLDNIVPFVSYVIRGKVIGEVIIKEDVQNEIKNEFGLFIPINSIEGLFNRLTKTGILKRGNKQFFVQKIIKEFSDFESNRSDMERHIGAVINEFMKFSQNRYEKVLTETKASKIILGFLSEFSIECLAAFEKNTPPPMELDIERSEQVLVGSFIKNLKDEFPERFKSFSQIVKGYMLANALFCPTLNDDKFGNVTFYLDTPLIIKFLGLNGDREMTVIKEMVGLLVGLRGTVAIFDHTQEEVSKFIGWLADHGHKIDVRNPAAVEMRKQGKEKSDMIFLRNGFVNDLRQEKIHVKNGPSFHSKNFKYQINETELEGVLQDEIRYTNNPDAVKYDVQSVRSIQVLRKARRVDHLEKSPAVLITSNTSFAKAIRGYESYNGQRNSYNVPSVVTDLDVTNLAWLKSPMQAPKIPEHRLISNAYAMLNPREGVWSKVIEEAEKLHREERVSEEALVALRSDPSLIHAINEQSLGVTDEKILSEVTENYLTKEARERPEKDKQPDKERQIANIDNLSDKVVWIVIVCMLFLILFSFFVYGMPIMNDVTIMNIVIFLAALPAIFGFIPKVRKFVSRKISKFIKERIFNTE